MCEREAGAGIDCPFIRRLTCRNILPCPVVLYIAAFNSFPPSLPPLEHHRTSLYPAMTSTLPLRPPTTGSSSTDGHARQSSLNSTLSRTASNESGAPRIPPKSVARRGGSTSSAQSPKSPSLGPLTQRKTRRVRRLKSQYPADSPERHVEYILVASFDIDKGPTMEHQFPGAISGDESMLAELMLPDQTHKRSEDWTIFFLHKDTSEEEELREERRIERLRRREERQKVREAAAANGETQVLDDNEEDTADEDEEEGGEGPPLIYVLNLVNTKQDNTVKRLVE